MVATQAYSVAQSESTLIAPIVRGVCRAGAGRRRLSRVVLTAVMLLAVAGRTAAQGVHQVLVLESADRGNLVIDSFTTNFHVDVDQRADRPVNFVQVVVGATGSGGAPAQAIVVYLQSIFVDRSPELIVTIAGPAAGFARKYRQRLFPDIPILFAAVDQQYLGNAPLEQNETAVTSVTDFPRIIDEILQLLPQTKQIAVVTGSGEIGQFWHRELQASFGRFRDRVSFVWLDTLSLEETLSRCASLPDHSAIFYVTFGTDATGAAYAGERVFAGLHARGNAPLFAGLSVYSSAPEVSADRWSPSRTSPARPPRQRFNC